MKIKISWDDFVSAATAKLRETYPVEEKPEFFEKHNYEPDSQCYSFPPAYVEFELTNAELARPRGAVTWSQANYEDQPDTQTAELRKLAGHKEQG